MDLENLDAALEIRQTELNFAIKTSRTGESWVKGVWAISGHENLDIPTGVETIKLVNDLEHSALYLGISVAKTSTTNGINFIKENDARLL